MRRLLILTLVLMTVVGSGALSAFAQDEMGTPMVDVSDQVSLDGSVTINAAYSEGPGFVVIHADNGGSFGAVIGYAAIPSGDSRNIKVGIDTSLATPVLYAMLHTDTGEVGIYEFGSVEGADGPVAVDGGVISPSFNVNIISAHDQLVSDNTVTIKSVVAGEAGWLVVHAGDASSFGPVLGQTLVNAGNNSDVVVTLDGGDKTNVVWPMLHLDTGEVGTYEFGAVEGADGPVVVNGAVAALPIWTVPHVRVWPQITVYADNNPDMDMMMGMEQTVTAASVLSEGAGWLVIHADNGGQPGPVLGQTLVQAGLNTNVVVTLAGELTPVVWPMLHVDTGEAGVYEFGAVEGADGPVAVDGNVVVFPVEVAPHLFLQDEATLTDGLLTIDGVLADENGWLVIHSSVDGAPGPVLGQTRVWRGMNSHVTVALEGDAGSQVFPMLHYDTGEAGVYEFGVVEGADGPVIVGGNVIVAPLAIAQ